MSAIQRPRPDDPRVQRTRAAVMEAARALFLRQGYAGTTMDEIAERAGITKRTLYNNYGDKEALFRQVVADLMGYAEAFARSLAAEFARPVTRGEVHARLEALAGRMALAILRPEVIQMRRMVIGEFRSFPELGRQYYDRAPGRVIRALGAGFARWQRLGLLRITPREATPAARRFAYLVVGRLIDEAVLTGEVPSTTFIKREGATGARIFLELHAHPGQAGPPDGPARE